MEDREKIIQDIKDNINNGKIVFMTIEGAATQKLEDFIKQPAEGMLYDLNRDLATLFTQAQTSKNFRFVNDIACAIVIKYLKEQNEKLLKELESTRSTSYFKQQAAAQKVSKEDASTIQEGFNTSLEIYM